MRDLWQSTMGGSVHIETMLKHGLWCALVDPTQLELAVLNLAINARDAMEVGGTLKDEIENVTSGPATYPEEPPAGDYVAIRVSDSGTGMQEYIPATGFEASLTTKEHAKARR